jgi:hypothetical protein
MSGDVKYALMLLSVALLWGIAGGVAPPDATELEPASPRVFASKRVVSQTVDPVHLSCYPADAKELDELAPHQSTSRSPVLLVASKRPAASARPSSGRLLACVIQQP